MTEYTEEELNTEAEVKLTLRDLIILNWGHESVSFVPGGEEAAEFAAAEAKLDAALNAVQKALV